MNEFNGREWRSARSPSLAFTAQGRGCVEESLEGREGERPSSSPSPTGFEPLRTLGLKELLRWPSPVSSFQRSAGMGESQESSAFGESLKQPWTMLDVGELQWIC